MTIYVVILQHAWMNERGHGTEYTAPLPPAASHSEAVAQGFTLNRSDDFNIGVLTDGRLTDLLWMNESIGEPPETLAQIAREIHRWQPDVVL